MEHPSFPATPQPTEQTIWSQSVLRFVIIGIAAGLVIGALTAVGQSVLNGDLFQLNELARYGSSSRL